MNEATKRVTDALTHHGHHPRRSGDGWTCTCPAHPDRSPSLSISEGKDGKALLHCHRGCETNDIVAAIGLTPKDLFPVPDRTSKSHGKVRDVSVSVKPSTRSAKMTFPEAHAKLRDEAGGRTFRTANELVAHLCKSRGKTIGRWTYRDPDGKPIGIVLRWDRVNRNNGEVEGKEILPIALIDREWVNKAMPSPRPLYGLREVLKAQTALVTIHEGEKAADAARSLCFTATTSSGGSGAARQTDWTPLAGKNVVLFPDNDKPGRKYRNDVCTMLLALDPPAKVRVVELPDLPPKGDIVDFIDMRGGISNAEEIRAEIETSIAAADRVEADEARAEQPSEQPFPTEALPEPLRAFVIEAAGSIGSDCSMVALPLLCMMAAAIGSTTSIELKEGWVEPAILWGALISESGGLKTPALKEVLKPVREKQCEAFRSHHSATEAYQTELARYKLAESRWKHDGGKGDPPEKPKAPVPTRLVVENSTTEALVQILHDNPRGVLHLHDELRGLFALFERYGGVGGGDESFLLSAFNGLPHTNDRKTGDRPTTHLDAVHVSIFGGIQPALFADLMTAHRRASGMLARFLVIRPRRRVKRWIERGVSAATRARLDGVYGELHTLRAVTDEGQPDKPNLVTLSPEAKGAFIRFVDEHGIEAAQFEGDLAACWAKLEAYAARLAFVVHLCRWAAADPTLLDPSGRIVDEHSVIAGITLARWFGGEAKRVYCEMNLTPEERERTKLIEHIRAKGGRMYLRDLRRSERFGKTSEEVEARLNELSERGLGRWGSDPQSPKGGPAARWFEVNEVTDTDETIANAGFREVVSGPVASADADPATAKPATTTEPLGDRVRRARSSKDRASRRTGCP